MGLARRVSVDARHKKGGHIACVEFSGLSLPKHTKEHHGTRRKGYDYLQLGIDSL